MKTKLNAQVGQCKECGKVAQLTLSICSLCLDELFCFCDGCNELHRIESEKEECWSFPSESENET